jgi:RimJ/RimL family protein N-acetyltransferase
VRLASKTQRLEAGRVELRRHASKDYPLYGKWYSDPEIWHLTSWAPAPMSVKSVQRLFEERELSRTDDSFAIFRKGEYVPIGIISLMTISDAHASAELSVILGPPEDRGRGYGTEAIEALLRYGFETLDLNRIGLSVFEFNEPAVAAYEKLGFREEGRMRKAIKRDDAFHDAILMSILRPEWQNGQGR